MTQRHYEQSNPEFEPETQHISTLDGLETFEDGFEDDAEVEHKRERIERVSKNANHN